jgi:predicted nuclease of restriction endonuclease-like (RecB) superfamily
MGGIEMSTTIQTHNDKLLQAVADIKEAILQGQYEAAKGVNRIQLAVYFGIGKYVSQQSRKGTWGTGALETISGQLRRELPGLRGYSATQLKEMRLFYEAWIMLDANSSVATDELENLAIANVEMETVNPSVATDELQITENHIDIYHVIQIPNIAEFPIEDFFKVPFTHHSRIVAGAKALEARYYYIHRTAEEHLSVDTLKKLIKQDAYGHREQMPSNFTKTISNAAMMRKAVMMFKDSYMLDFINVEEIGIRDSIDVDERVVEREIVNKVKNFIMTIGRDFAFIGNQQLLEVYGVEHFPDLLFFNRELNAMVVIELKMGEFKTSYLGQLMGYLTILDDKIRKPHENPSIGIILCKSANREYVEFMIRDYSKPMGVATYKTADDMPENIRKALPDIDALKHLMSDNGPKQKENEV